MKNELIKAEIIVKDTPINVIRINNTDFISLTDLAKYQNSSDPSFTVKNWLRRVSTIDYIGLWEQLHNSNFNLVEFDQIKTEYGKNSFAMSPTQWIKRTNILHLVVLSNLENLNAEMIASGISQSERIVKLNNIAKKQLQLLKNNSSVRRLEKMDEHLKLE